MYLYKRVEFCVAGCDGFQHGKGDRTAPLADGFEEVLPGTRYHGTCVGCRIRAKRKIFHYYFEVSRSCKSAVIAGNPLTHVALLIKPTWPNFARLEEGQGVHKSIPLQEASLLLTLIFPRAFHISLQMEKYPLLIQPFQLHPADSTSAGSL